MYKCRHFIIQELVDEGTYNLYKEHFGRQHFETFLWKLFDQDLLRAIDDLRDKHGSCTVNNWHLGGDFSWSGLRHPASPWYSKGSMHSLGKAFDLKFAKVSADKVREGLRSSAPAGITRVELGTSWVHIDSADTCKDHIYFFNA